MFQLRQLKIFLAAAETLSFTRAAKQVHLSQPGVTEQIQALEQSVGQLLFIRKNNSLTLTAAGERLAGRARELLAMADDTLRVVRDNLDEQAGTIRVAAPQTLCTCFLIPLLAGYVDLHPGARVVIQERNSSATAQTVMDGTVDLGLVHGWPANDANLRAYPVARDTPVVVMPPGHPLGRAADVKPDALAAFPLIVTMEGCRYREYLEALLQEAAVRPRTRGVADSVAALLQMVSAGLGVSILPRMAVDAAVTAARVELRALSTVGEGLPICLLTTGREPARYVAAFIEMVRLAATGLDEPMAALDVKNRAGRVTVAQQEDDSIGDVVGRSDPAHRKSLCHRRQ
jgi:DNA-binding transcriptional LysR family regulator